MKKHKIEILMIGPRAGKTLSGGIVTVIESLIEHISNDFLITYIVTMRPMKINRILGVIIRMGMYVKALFRISLTFLNKNKKIAHVHMASHSSFFRKSTIIIFLRMLKIPIVIHLHSGYFNTFFADELNSAMQKYVKWIFSLANKTIVLTNSWNTWYKNEINSNNSIVIYNGVKDYYNQKSIELNKREKNILFIGRLDKKKGIYDLLYAFEEVLQHIPDVKLVICGNGEIEECKTLVNELSIGKSVDFLGWIGEKEKYKLLNEAKIFVLPSYYEGLPMGVLEAMSAGIGIVTTNVGGIPEAIENEKNGLLIEPNQLEQLSQSLISLLENENKLKVFSTQARKDFANKFDIIKITKETEDLYYSIMKKNL